MTRLLAWLRGLFRKAAPPRGRESEADRELAEASDEAAP